MGSWRATGDLQIGGPVFAFALLLSCATGLIFALTPALRGTGNLEATLGESGRSGGLSVAAARRSAALVALQVALCTVLAVGAGLLVKSLWQLSQVDPGFEPNGVVALRVEPPASRYGEDEQRRSYYRQVEAALAALPGVESVGSANLTPLSRGALKLALSPDGDPVPPSQRPMLVSYRLVTSGYVDTLGLGMLAGRSLEGSDRADSQGGGHDQPDPGAKDVAGAERRRVVSWYGMTVRRG